LHQPYFQRGGSHWLGFPTGSATFTFANPTNVFGSYFTGLQTTLGTTLTIQFSDGASQTLNLPVQNNGGAQFFGFTDTSYFNSLTINRPGNDAWGMDNVTIATAITTAAVPEPESYAMMLLGLGFVGAIARRKKIVA
jgi:PEP-CTERM motif